MIEVSSRSIGGGGGGVAGHVSTAVLDPIRERSASVMMMVVIAMGEGWGGARHSITRNQLTCDFFY